ncbi:dopamine N-acetyltransferase-like [Teleopsis dalmanni]|uniref:dopamine N-acetyltransferase-like n=1 Tax=Teleopsis dalmanni TaxID=139649 RepID=UPI0018CC8809|nr:dopamine N-acetyltransferase-like [Teleopsis dalmanni]
MLFLKKVSAVRLFCDRKRLKTMVETILTTKVIKREDYERVLEFLFKYYYPEEPLTIGTEPKEPDPNDIKFNMGNIKHGACFMALANEGKKEEKVAGVVLAGPKGATEYEHLCEEAEKLEGTKWGTTIKFLAKIEYDANVFEKYDITEAYHAHVLAVDSTYRGKSLGSMLLTKLRDHLSSLGCKLLTVDCTSVYSARLCERLHMKCGNIQYYADYKDEKGEQIFKPPAPHDCVKTYSLFLE